jgi:hypothetical protein
MPKAKHFSHKLSLFIVLVAIVGGIGYFIINNSDPLDPGQPENLPNILAQRHSHLLQARLSLFAFTNLDAATSNFAAARSSGLAYLQKAINSGREDLERNLPDVVPPSDLPLSTERENLTASTIDQIHNQTLDDLQDIHDAMIAYEEAASDIYRYDASVDLSQLDPVTQSDQIKQRAYAAEQGITRARQRISEISAYKNLTDNVDQATSDATVALKNLSAAAEAGSTEAIAKNQRAAVNTIAAMRPQIFITHTAPLRASPRPEQLAQLTNLILYYALWPKVL